MSLPPAAPAPPRSTDSALYIPSLGRGALLLGRALRLRCPHCGGGAVLQGWHPRQWGTAHEQCEGCGFRFARSDERYFAGAMICNLLLAELLFALGMLAVVLATWPDVPWDALTWVAAAGMAIVPFLFYPVAMVLWLTVDVLFRPVGADELG